MPRPRKESPTDCPAGYQYYKCAANPFHGCCSIDPCGLHEGCPVKNQPGFLNSPDTVASSSASSAPPATTSSQPLHATVTVGAVAPVTVTRAPTTITVLDATSSTRSQPHSTSSSTTAPLPSSDPKTSPAARMAASLFVEILGGLVVMGILYMLWRHFRQRKGAKADQRSMLMKKLRKKKSYRLPRGASGSAPLIPADTNKPVPPVPTYEAPWQGSIPEAGQERDGVGERSLTDLRFPRSSTSRQTSIRAVPFSPSRAGDGLPRTSRSKSSRKDGEATGGGPSRPVSAVESFFDSSPARKDSGLDSTWMDSETENDEPPEFHGLSAPPRSREGTRSDLKRGKPTD